ncbi:DinB family protein [Ramlibacter rhizophilus]|uniref:DUF664 domain-containing protein n=1 Tax=Ramlibacter rhizophilus TaxID=1781167 RepID=A0A4Z0BL35_9BURK|nr:DinB family protein [Ramlibacter rhizophilus]TFY99500.1 DUF664 domain-containing protein [Ramlibacter rhizophilus]
MTLHDYFRQLAAYHAWASQRLLEPHLRELSGELLRRDLGLFFRSIHGTLNHLLVAERLWQARVMDGESPTLRLDAELHADRDELARELLAAAARWQAWIAAQPAAAFDGELRYRRGNGEAVVVPLAPTLGHVFNHATHHRGQITAALTALGRPGPELDWIYLLQQGARALGAPSPKTL